MKEQMVKAGFQKKHNGNGRSQKLIPYQSDIHPDRELINDLTRVALSIELTMKNMGATPGKEYTRLDLLRMAMPLVIAERS